MASTARRVAVPAALVAGALALSACSSGPVAWQREGINEAEYRLDAGSCRSEADSFDFVTPSILRPGSPSEAIGSERVDQLEEADYFRACMNNRGYRKTAPPPGTAA